MGNSNGLSSEQTKVNNVSGESILDQILDNFIDALSKDANFGAEMAQSLRDIISKGEYSDKETFLKLLKRTNKNL